MLLADEPWQRAALGGGFGFGLGVAKEIYDATGHGDPSLRDLTWDVIGCAFGVGVSLLLDYALRAPPRHEPITSVAARAQVRATAW
jgi:putative lipoprotein